MKEGLRPKINLLPKDGEKQIIEEAVAVLAEVGVQVENEEARDLLAGAGARIEQGRVRIPETLCESCMKKVPGTITLFDRDGNEAAMLGGDNVVFDPGSAALSIYDFAEGRIRKPTTRDVVEFTVLTDALPAYAAQSTGVVPADMPEELADRFRLFLALVHGVKPIVTGTFAKDAFATMLSFLVALRGSEEELRAKPLAVFDCCPSPPLMWSDLTCSALIECARHGIPAELVSMPLTGATAPVTLAGALVQHTAENLSGIVIHQLANPGAPIIYGGSPACFDMRKGTTPMGAVETMMIDVAYVQIGKSQGFPVHAYMGLSDAKKPDAQAGLESALGIVLAALAGVNMVSGPGMLNFESCQSLEKLVIDNEICSMAERLLQGIAFREEVVGLEILRELATSKSFLTSEHTRRYFREEAYYPGEVIDRSTQGEWEKSGSLDAAERAHRLVRRLLGQAEPRILPEAKVAELEGLMVADAKKHGLHELPSWRYPARRDRRANR